MVTTNHADLVQRLQDGRHRTDVGRQIMEDMGYSVYWWNGAEDNQAAANLNIHIGSSALGNHVVLKLPEPDAVPSLYTRASRINFYIFSWIFLTPIRCFGLMRNFSPSKQSRIAQPRMAADMYSGN
ncbi:hypothetical protein I547_6086 [Mycobacterium kansasii 824]|nr:hypothetical protein I547_6086 [Mycobacterium kansasii 824]